MIITADKKYCVATVQLSGDNLRQLSLMPGFHKWEGRKLLFRPTGANINHIQVNWPDAHWSEEAVPHLQAWVQEAKLLQQNKELKGQLLEDSTSYVYKSQPYVHQKQAFLLGRDRVNYGLLMEQGTGKSKVILDNVAYLYAKGEIDALLVVSVNGVHTNWVNEQVPEHLPDWCEYVAYAHRTEMTVSKRNELHEVLATKDKLIIVAMNIEGFTSEANQKLLAGMLLSHRCMLVIDESTRIKNHSAKRTVFLTKAGRCAKYRRILTGTPVTKGAEDLYAQLTFLDPMILGFDSFYTFRNHFCVTRTFGTGREKHEEIVGYKNLEELYHILDGCSFRVLKADCLDLPPKVYKRVEYELTKTQRKLYDDLKRDFIAEHNGETVAEALAMVRLLRLQQITLNWWPGGEEGKLVPIESKNPRIDVMKSVLQDMPHKALIWARFRDDIELVLDALGRAAVPYYGGVSDDAKEESKDRFNHDDSVLYFVANAQSAGLGLTLLPGTTQFYYSNSFDLEQRLQSEDRPHRIGQEHTVTIHDAEALRTVDRKIINALRAKKNIADMILHDPKSFFLEEAV